MSKTTAINRVRLNLVDLISGAADPSSGGGVAAQIGSQYQRQSGGVGQAWLKTAAADTAWTQMAQSMAWYNVRDYGAVGDGVTDDRAAIQAAIDACQASTNKGQVYFPRGTYKCTQNGALGYSFLLNGATNMQLCGAGEGTVIKMSGNAGAAAWDLFRLQGSCAAIRFMNMTLDGSGVTNPANSDNLIHASTVLAAGNMTDISVFGCKFTGMVAGSGDAVRFRGAAGNLIQRIWVAENLFDGVGEYGVHLKEGCSFAWVTQNYFTNCLRDIVIDSTSDVAISSIEITDNVIVHVSTDKLAMQLNGPATTLISLMTVAQNIILGGFVEMSQTQISSIVGNVQTSGAFASGNAAWKMFGTISDLAFSGNYIDRATGASAGVCVSLESSGGNAATRVRIGNNVLANEIAGGGFILATDCKVISIGNNLGRNTNSAGASTAYGIEVDAVGATVDDLLIQGNQLSAAAGSFAAAVLLKVNGQDVINVAILGNMGDQIDYGAEFNDAGAGTFSGRVMYASNNFDSGTGDFNNTGAAAVVPVIGLNGSTFGANAFSGTGSPEGVITARIGSLYFNKSGGDSSTLWYKESGTGNTGWIAVATSILQFGVGTTGTVSTALFMGSGYITTPTASEIQVTVTRPGTIRNLYTKSQAAGTDAATTTFTVRKNAVDQALTSNVANTTANATSNDTNSAHAFTVVAGDGVSIKITKSGSVTAGQTDACASVELA